MRAHRTMQTVSRNRLYVAAVMLVLGPLLGPAAGTARAQPEAEVSQPEDEARAAADLERGRRFFAQGRFAESAAAYRRVTRAAPRNARGFAGLARAYASLGAQQFAIPAYRQAIELLPEPPAMLYVALGDSLLASGDRGGAAQAYVLALRRDPADEAARGRYDRLGGRSPEPLATSTTRSPTIVAPRSGPGLPFLAGGVPLAVVGLGAAVGCGVMYAMEPESSGPAATDSDPLTWIACMGVGALTTAVGLVLIGFGFSQGIDANPTAVAAGDVRLGLAPTSGGAMASASAAF